MTRATRLATIALLILFDLPLYDWIARGHTNPFVTEAIFWTYTAIVIGFVTLVERRSLSSIGLIRPTWKTLAFGLVGGIVMTASIAFIYLVIYPALHASPDIGTGTPTSKLPFALNLAIVVRAAVFEEIFYRGFAIERLSEITRSRSLAAALSWTAFTLAHLASWGWLHLLVAGTGGAILTALYLWRRDLACTMVAHFITDAIGFLA